MIEVNKSNKNFVISTAFVDEVIKRNLSINEFLLLMFFDNDYEPFFDVELINKFTKMKEEDIMMAFASLLEKNIIKVETGKNSHNKVVEKIDLDNFYNNYEKEVKNERVSKIKEDVYTSFEKAFGRTLSPMDYNLINDWVGSGIDEEVILRALKEASISGTSSMRYIDKILFDWGKKGIKKKEDIKDAPINVEDKLAETTLLKFNWLDNE